MGRSLLLHTVKMAFLLQIFWQGLLWGLTAQASEEAQVLCSGFTCYTLHWGRHSWKEAQKMCEDNGGNLMTPKSQNEMSLIQQLLDKMPKWGAGREVEVRLWIGLHREKGKCYQQHQLLKGFSWVTGGEEAEYSNWDREPRGTCIAKRCVSLQGKPSSSQELAWMDGHCNSAVDGEPGVLCQFSFQGMCRPLRWAGTGAVIYTTPFGISTASLVTVPFGSAAEVACEPQGQGIRTAFFICKAHLSNNTFEWSSAGPLCALPSHGCNHSNGGCEHECQELGGGLFQCACHSGYQLGGDQRSCLLVDYCSSNPCQGQCLPRLGGFDCLCSLGYTLADDGLNCVDIDECGNTQSPCEQVCVNSKGSFTCHCNNGYKPAGAAGQVCQDIDECAEDTPCDQMCSNTHGSFICSCRPGYQLEDTNNSSCLDVDECQTKPCEQMCMNYPGSYHCKCRSGWTLAPNGISCLPDTTDSTTTPPPQGEGELGNAPASIRPLSETPALPSNTPIRAEAERVSVSQEGFLQPGVLHKPLDAEDQVGDDSIDSSSSSSKQLLYYILGAVVAVLLLMAFALSLVTYRKMKAKKAKKKAKSAADNYSWVPDQKEARAGENEDM